MKNIKCELWTIGHSNRSLEEFLELLKEYKIKILIDIRRFPTSKIEHFKKEKMEEWLPKNGIEYIWLGEELGGYRYGGYKKYMKTKSFKNGIEKLLEIAKMKRTCIMFPSPKLEDFLKKEENISTDNKPSIMPA